MGIHMTPEEAKKWGVNMPKGKKRSQDAHNPGAEHRGTEGFHRRIFLEACRAHNLPEPVWEYEFHPERKWKFDWLFDDDVALEIEGGLYGRGEACAACGRRPPGAHSSIERLKSDMEKYNWAQILGYKVIRCTPEQVADGSVFPLLHEALYTEYSASRKRDAAEAAQKEADHDPSPRFPARGHREDLSDDDD